jgi:hypothetical protein
VADLTDDEIEIAVDISGEMRRQFAGSKFGRPDYGCLLRSDLASRLVTAVPAMAAEIRRRRAADLSDADIESLRGLRDMLRVDFPCGWEREIAALWRVTGDEP